MSQNLHVTNKTEKSVRFFWVFHVSHVSSWVHPRVVMAGAPTRTPPGLKADASPCTALRFNVIEAASPQLVEKPRVKIQK